MTKFDYVWSKDGKTISKVDKATGETVKQQALEVAFRADPGPVVDELRGFVRESLKDSTWSDEMASAWIQQHKDKP